jgi:uncharacterized protein (DUF2252 family)
MRHESPPRYPPHAGRQKVLLAEQRRKMARSAHAYVRGATRRFYEWLDEGNHVIPDGPLIWICGDYIWEISARSPIPAARYPS